MSTPAPAARTEWHAARQHGIGGSDVHHVFSEKPHGCARRLWFEKRGVPEDYPEPPSAVMARGTQLEALVAERYGEETGRVLIEEDARVHPEYPWARVNVDRVIAPVAEHDGPGVLEVKTHNFWLFREVKRSGLQPAHILQVQHALFVTGYTWGAFAILHPDSWELVHFDLARDEALIAQIRDAGARFWKQVEHGPMPEPLGEVDRRCLTCPWRRQCRTDAVIAAAQLPPGERDATLEEDHSLDEILADYREAKKLADDAAETLDLVSETLKARLGERQAVACHGAKIFYRTQVASRWDTRALESQHPELAPQFKRAVTSRPLRVVLAP